MCASVRFSDLCLSRCIFPAFPRLPLCLCARKRRHIKLVGRCCWTASWWLGKQPPYAPPSFFFSPHRHVHVHVIGRSNAENRIFSFGFCHAKISKARCENLVYFSHAFLTFPPSGRSFSRLGKESGEDCIFIFFEGGMAPQICYFISLKITR